MRATLRFLLPAGFFAAFILPASGTPPISSPDNFTTPQDTALVVPAATGVLANDNANGNLQIEAAAVGTPRHGTLQLNADGSFTYTPTAGYNGGDSFTYQARKVVQPFTFTIDSTQSSATIQVTVHAVGTSQAKSSTSRLGGMLTVGTLLPHTAGPFNLVQVTSVNATLLDAIALHYSLLFGLFTADITADPGALSVTMPTAGAAAAVNAAGTFSQTGNTLQTHGTVHVTYSGTTSDQSLDGVMGASDFDNASITSDGTTLTLTVPINFSTNGVVVSTSPSVTADVLVTGTMKATAAAINNVAETSSVTTVSLVVTYLHPTNVARVGSNLVMNFDGSVAGGLYQLQTSVDLAGWSNVGSPIFATSPTLTVTIPAAADPKRFYRLHAL